VQLGEAYRVRVEILRDLIEIVDREIAMLEKQTAPYFAGDLGYHAVQAIPGVGPVLAAVFVAEIGDIGRFTSARHSVQLGRAHPHPPRVRREGPPWPHHQAGIPSRALGRRRGGGPPAGRHADSRHHQRVGERRGTQIGRVAAARKLLILVYYGLRDGEIRCLARRGENRDGRNPVRARH
jgi:hypothetical protein